MKKDEKTLQENNGIIYGRKLIRSTHPHNPVIILNPKKNLAHSRVLFVCKGSENNVYRE